MSSSANGNGNGKPPAWPVILDTGPGIEDRLPPHNPEAERSVLGSILLDSDVLADLVDRLHVHHFYSDAHQIVYRAMLDLYELGTPIDVVTLSDMLRRQNRTAESGGDGYLERCIYTVPHAGNYGYYAEMIIEVSAQRQLMETAKEILKDGYSKTYTSDELLGRASRNLALIEQSALGDPDDDFNLNPAPARMGAAAFRGLVGEIVGRIAPETEACPEAILGQFVVAFGNMVGRRPHWRVNATAHRANLNLCVVGATGAGRKGTAWDCTHWLLGLCDPEWALKPVLSGLTSGEGLIDHAKKNPGPILVVETEFGRLLSNCRRENNTLSHVIRQAFDGGFLWIPSRKDPMFVQDAHISLIGHITYSELLSKITQVDVENGMVNRFLWMHSYRVGSLPEGGDFHAVTDALGPLADELGLALEFARDHCDPKVPYLRDSAAKEMWAPLYDKLTEPGPGKYGNAIERRAPIVTRLAMVYAILDRDNRIRPAHIEAALAFWDYCDGTAKRIFGEPKRDKKLAKLIELLENTPGGLTKTAINRKLGGGHLSPNEVDRLIESAELTGKCMLKEIKAGGRCKHVLIHHKYGGSK